MRAANRAPQGFTISEVVVVIGIVTLVASLTLPSLATARQASQRSVCAANLHAIYQAACAYSTQYDGWMGPTGEIYGNRSPWYPSNMILPWPANMRDYYSYLGTVPDSEELSVPDFYCALGYLPCRNLGGRAYFMGSAKHVVRGDEILICPAAQAAFPVLAASYGGSYGSTRATYFFSSLMMDWPYSSSYANYPRRDNAYGPWRLDELVVPHQTFFSGDGMAMSDVGAFGYAIGPEEPGSQPPVPVDAAMHRQFRYHHVGNPWRCFGVIAAYASEQDSNLCYFPWQYYHAGGPNGLFWDGHAEAVTPPPDDDLYRLRKNLTRNGIDQYP